jgi:hypothetical protein
MVGKQHVLTGESRQGIRLVEGDPNPLVLSPPGLEHPQLGEMTSGRCDKHYS